MIPILVFAGTRPEIIKTAPVIHALCASKKLKPVFCYTGQHADLGKRILNDFGLTPDISLQVMKAGQDLAALTSALFRVIPPVLHEVKPAMVLIQGDTSTVAAAAQCAFYAKIPIGHIEAGLRTHDIQTPFPEEFNRRVVSLLASLHFAPTKAAAHNLRAEGVPPESVHVVGNTVVDALRYMLQHIEKNPPVLPEELGALDGAAKGYVLVTGHRRENFGGGLECVCEAVAALAAAYPDLFFIYTVHPNPYVQKTTASLLTGIRNVLLVPPLGYAQCVKMLHGCLFLISDSGGIQEEAASLGKYVLVTRESTERPEAVEAGWCTLVGTDKDYIIAEGSRLITEETPGTMKFPARAVPLRNIYGNGLSAAAIKGIVEQFVVGKP